MSIYEQALGDITGGRVLDVATGRGDFIGTLKECLPSYTGLAGIDVSERALKDARDSYGEESVRFTLMDAERMSFGDESFGTVCAAKSLHHWTHIPQVLGEMVRVLRPGGRLMVSDMHRDVGTGAPRTDMYIHYLAAEMHTCRGLTHDKTFTRQEIVDLIGSLGLSSIVCYDWSDTASDPMDAEALREKEVLIDRILQDTRGMPDYQAFKRRGEQLRQRLREMGIQSEPVLVVVGQK